MKPGSALLFVLFALAACSRPAPHVERAAITHGALDAGDPAVAALLLRVSTCGESPGVYCTATLVAPRALLTAAHCLDAAPAGATIAFFGADARGVGEAHGVVASFRHPDASVDLALLALDDAAGAAPLALDSGPAPDQRRRRAGPCAWSASASTKPGWPGPSARERRSSTRSPAWRCASTRRRP